MPTPVSTLDNMTKHLTNEEKAARLAAEQALKRETVNLQKPKFVSGAAAKLWEQTIDRMTGIELLDDLDSEVLGLYCDQVARRNEQEKLRRKLMRTIAKCHEDNAEQLLSLLDQADKLARSVAALERQILQYADKLGLTPSGRFHIARKRAEMSLSDPDEDLFG
ncbi:MAG: P27 family phage terminase small subunit [Butyricicoccus pullicaecorum]|nr:P27 family phage terminase small subunit [Butyricicoccus pullicaecorum]